MEKIMWPCNGVEVVRTEEFGGNWVWMDMIYIPPKGSDIKTRSDQG